MEGGAERIHLQIKNVIVAGKWRKGWELLEGVE